MPNGGMTIAPDVPCDPDAPVSASHDQARHWLSRWATLGTGWLWAPAATLVLYSLRAPQTFLHPQLWAEDAVIFFSDQRRLGVRAFVVPYAGYLHAAPRLTAAAASLFSAVHLPAFYAWTSVAIALWTAATIATARLPFAWLLGAVLLLPPHAGEIFGTLTNVQWVMAPGLALSVAAPSPFGRGARISQLAFCLVAGLTGPFSVFLAPIGLWRWWQDRWNPYSAALCAIVCGTAAIQAWVIVSMSSPHGSILEPWDLARTIIDRTIGQLAAGHRTIDVLDAIKDIVVVCAAVAALGSCRSTFASLFGFGAFFMGAVWLKFSDLSFHNLDGIETGDRYFYIPRLILLWAVIITAITSRRPSAILAVAALAMIALDFSQWRQPKLLVLPWKPLAEKIDRGEAVSITINPASSVSDGWTLVVPGKVSASPPTP